MGANIPSPIKVEVIRKWLAGKSRDKIAQELGIGAGTVSSILKESRQNDPPFDVMREVAIKLRRSGYSVESFAPLIRWRKTSKKRGTRSRYKGCRRWRRRLQPTSSTTARGSKRRRENRIVDRIPRCLLL